MPVHNKPACFFLKKQTNQTLPKNSIVMDTFLVTLSAFHIWLVNFYRCLLPADFSILRPNPNSPNDMRPERLEFVFYSENV